MQLMLGCADTHTVLIAILQVNLDGDTYQFQVQAAATGKARSPWLADCPLDSQTPVIISILTEQA